jgi:hypothetical protein
MLIADNGGHSSRRAAPLLYVAGRFDPKERWAKP